MQASPWVQNGLYVDGIPWDGAPHDGSSGLSETASINGWVDPD